MQEFAPGIYTFQRPLRFLGLEVGTRMTVLRLADGLLIHFPIDVLPESLQELGEPCWVLAPNKLLHLFVKPWVDAGIEAWAAPGLPEKRGDIPFSGVIETDKHPFGPEVSVVTLTCFDVTNEVVLFHKPSKTLVVTGILFNFPRTAPALTRAAMWCAGCYPGCRASHLERLWMNRKLARRELTAILDFDFQRIVMAHGDVVENNAKKTFARAYRLLCIV